MNAYATHQQRSYEQQQTHCPRCRQWLLSIHRRRSSQHEQRRHAVGDVLTEKVAFMPTASASTAAAQIKHPEKAPRESTPRKHPEKTPRAPLLAASLGRPRSLFHRAAEAWPAPAGPSGPRPRTGGLASWAFESRCPAPHSVLRELVHVSAAAAGSEFFGQERAALQVTTASSKQAAARVASERRKRAGGQWLIRIYEATPCYLPPALL